MEEEVRIFFAKTKKLDFKEKTSKGETDIIKASGEAAALPAGRTMKQEPRSPFGAGA